MVEQKYVNFLQALNKVVAFSKVWGKKIHGFFLQNFSKTPKFRSQICLVR